MSQGKMPLRLVVVGGGFTGAALVIHAVRASARPLDIVMVEPSADLGRGIAYGTEDPAHRINVPSDKMSLFEADPSEATRWFFDTGILPDAASQDEHGHFYVPRHAYGSFMGDALRRTLALHRDRVVFTHRRTVATGVSRIGEAWSVATADDPLIAADVVALCFGHAVPQAPCAIGAGVRRAAKFVPDPWARDALGAIAPADSVLVVGTGLTMADTVVSLRQHGHTGPITAISRRGLLSRPHGHFLSDIDILEDEAVPATALGLLRLLRRRIRRDAATLGWQPIADAFRAKLPVLWRALPQAEKQRAMRLLPFWEVHRFRIAPQLHAALLADEARGKLRVERAGLAGLDHADGRFVATLRRQDDATEEAEFQAVVLCTGPEKNLRRNPLIAALLAEGLIRLDETGLGLAVDAISHALAHDGSAWPTMFAFGPMTRGSFGEMTGAPDIARHIERLAPQLFEDVPARQGA